MEIAVGCGERSAPAVNMCVVREVSWGARLTAGVRGMTHGVTVAQRDTSGRGRARRRSRGLRTWEKIPYYSSHT
eukprot:1686503-Prymnesium_polylepis.1